MMDGRKTESNMVSMAGRIVSEPCQIREERGERLYAAHILTGRASGVTDRIPLIVPGKLIEPGDFSGRMVSVGGQFRSHNRREEGRSRLMLAVFVREIGFLEEGCPIDCTSNNQLFLDGHICKAPKYRKTPKGREIADVLLAVNRAHGKSDYIPCIVWGSDAWDVARLGVGTALWVSGRIQSREYAKALSETESETRVAYEVSAIEVGIGDGAMHGKGSRQGRWD